MMHPEMKKVILDTCSESFNDGLSSGLCMVISLLHMTKNVGGAEMARRVLVEIWDDYTEEQKQQIFERSNGLVDKETGEFTNKFQARSKSDD